MLSRQPLAGAAPAAVAAAAAAASPATTLETLMAELAKQVAASHAAAATAAAPVCVSRNAQTPIRQGVTAHSAGPLRLAYTPGRSGAAAAQAATAAARAEASKNADPANAAKYAAAGSGAAVATAPGTASGEDHLLVADVVMASAAVLPGGKESVVDTTGAGDSFIGSVLYGLSTGLPMEQTLRLAAVVAACKCTMLGARPGLPARSQISRDLLVPPPLPSAQ